MKILYSLKYYLRKMQMYSQVKLSFGTLNMKKPVDLSPLFEEISLIV